MRKVGSKGAPISLFSLRKVRLRPRPLARCSLTMPSMCVSPGLFFFPFSNISFSEIKKSNLQVPIKPAFCSVSLKFYFGIVI